MRDYEKKSAEKKSELYESQGRLREGAARKTRDGKDHLTGYRPREHERGGRPREAGRLENTFGDIAVGTNRKKEITVLTSRRRNQDGPAVREDEKVLRGESAQRMELIRGKFLTNSHDEKKSALAYSQSHDKSPQMMLNQFRAMMEKRDQQTARQQVGFLSRKAEKAELKELRSRELELRAQGDADAKAELRAIERRRQELQQILVDKKAQEHRLKQVLQKAQEESRRRTEESWERPFTLAALLNTAGQDDGSGEVPEDAENTSEAEETGETPDETGELSEN